ncbi:MAG: hypothetical protein DI585_03205 [Pseudomonas fluorescens]|nr:MAG: hypothetical protein DI585_03205 [Pseudomonas fluorescens]
MDTTSTAPFRVIINPNPTPAQPVTSTTKSRNFRKSALGLTVINNEEEVTFSLVLGFEIRCHLVPPLEIGGNYITHFPHQFDAAMDEIIADMSQHDAQTVFSSKSSRKRLPSTVENRLGTRLRMSHCRGHDRIWREPSEIFRNEKELNQLTYFFRARLLPYLTAFQRRGWKAEMQLVIYTPPPSIKPVWFKNFETAHHVKWDARPW